MNSTPSALQRHPLSALFSHLDLQGEDLSNLVKDIQEQGLLSPITTHEGMILDGWNRYTACCMAGVEPILLPLHPGGDPWAFVKASNMLRRHMSPAERVAIFMKKERMEGGVQNCTPQEPEFSKLRIPTEKTIAKDLDVSMGTAHKAAVVMKANDPALESALEQKKVSLDEAAKLAKMPEEERHAALEAPKPEPSPKTKPADVEALEAELEDLKGRISEMADMLKTTSEQLEAAQRVLDAEDLRAQFEKEVVRAHARATVAESRNRGLMNEVADLKGRLKSALRKIERLEKAELGRAS